MIEPSLFACPRMPDDGGANLARSQAVLLLPLDLNGAGATIGFHRLLVGRLKDRLPGQPEAVAKVTHIHPLLIDEALPDARRQTPEDPPAIGQGSLSARRGRLLTVKVKLQREGHGIGML